MFPLMVPTTRSRSASGNVYYICPLRVQSKYQAGDSVGLSRMRRCQSYSPTFSRRFPASEILHEAVAREFVSGKDVSMRVGMDSSICRKVFPNLETTSPPRPHMEVKWIASPCKLLASFRPASSFTNPAFQRHNTKENVVLWITSWSRTSSPRGKSGKSITVGYTYRQSQYLTWQLPWRSLRPQLTCRATIAPEQ